MGGKHKKCKFVGGYLLTASFGYRDREGTQFCSKHKEEGMVNLLCRNCECGRARPTYNFEGLKARFCKECMKEGMINVNDKKCKCGSAIPTFNLKGLKPEYCSKCKSSEMINVKDEPCKCGKSSRPNFNYEGLKPEYCSLCKWEGMVDVVHALCVCGKSQANSNFEGLPPKYCKLCKTEGMVLIGKRTCIQCNFLTANFNLVGEKKPLYCSNCKTSDMINTYLKCKNDGCVSYGNRNYKTYCVFCYQHLFPDDDATKNIRYKTKENYVRDFLDEKFNGFIHDVPLWTGGCDCSHKRRIDFRMLINNTLLCIEVDENQHKRYDKKDEEIRYDDLFMAHGGKFIFIRFNPDKFLNLNGTSKNPYMKLRMEELEKEIKKQINRINNYKNNELLEVFYLFYDGFDYNL